MCVCIRVYVHGCVALYVCVPVCVLSSSLVAPPLILPCILTLLFYLSLFSLLSSHLHTE